MPKQVEEKEPSVFDFLRLGESYTSLILGIVVVIVSTVLLLSFVHNKNKATTPEQKTQITQVSPTPEPTESSVTVMVTPSVVPTKAEKKEVRKGPKAAVPIKEVKKEKKEEKPAAKKGTHTVATDENLWIIAEKHYKSGYNWVDIARANKLNNPNNIHVGDKLALPKVKSKVATVVEPTKPATKATKDVAKVTPKPTKEVAKVTPTTSNVAKAPAKVAVQPGMEKITANKYKVVDGDNLWNIAVRAYADGYQWVKIATANKLANPDIIHPGNVLTLPRK